MPLKQIELEEVIANMNKLHDEAVEELERPMLRAIILRGKYKGLICEVSQWCNDWFKLESEDSDISRKAFKPSSLGFDENTMDRIKTHENNGTLHRQFRIATSPSWAIQQGFTWSFKKNKIWLLN